MLYFAYGSNMDWLQIKNRCPSAQFVRKALLKGYDFGFTRKSKNRDCGVMDIVKADGEQVWGVVYQIDELDVRKLDQSEGYAPGRVKNAYQRIECIVYEDGDLEKPITAMTYEVVEKAAATILPNQEYKALIVNGADYWRLPEDYINQLRLIVTID